jgi:glycerol kinase
LRSGTAEATAVGTCLLAGLHAGVWQDAAHAERQWQESARFIPQMSGPERSRRLKIWSAAVERSRHWAQITEPMGGKA